MELGVSGARPPDALAVEVAKTRKKDSISILVRVQNLVMVY